MTAERDRPSAPEACAPPRGAPARRSPTRRIRSLGIVHGGCERLARQILLVSVGRVEQLGIAVQSQEDPVGDLEPGVASRALDGVDDLARKALAAKLGIELEGQGDG